MNDHRIISPERHFEISHRFIPNAEEWFERGDMPEASEMAWGAAAHCLKSIAKRRGWLNRTHRDLFRVVDRLAGRTADPDGIRSLFRVMNGLHSNFYEDWFEDNAVRTGIEDAKDFIARLEKEFAA